MPKNKLTATIEHPTTKEIEMRLDGMAEAVRLLQSRMDRMPTPDIVQADVDSLRVLMGTRIDGLHTLVDAEFAANRTALDAALLTRKEATDELKFSFSKQVENLEKDNTLLRDRMNRSEGQGSGLDKGWGILVSAAGIVGIIVTILLTRT